MSTVVLLKLFLSLFMVIHVAKSEDEEVKHSLITFARQATLNNGNTDILGWNITTDPCIDRWTGVKCDILMNSVREIVLDGFGLVGEFDVGSLCKAPSLHVLSFQNNSFTGVISQEIGKCKQLTHLFLSSNHFSGSLPDTILDLHNLKRFEIAENNFSGKLPNLQSISGLVSFLAHDNNFSGEIPIFDFAHLHLFNVSNNDLSGPIPNLNGNFGPDSFSGNPGLCGPPLSNACPPTPSQ